MAVIDPVFEITPNAIDGIRRSTDPEGVEGLMLIEPSRLTVAGQVIERLEFGDLVLPIDRGTLTLLGGIVDLDTDLMFDAGVLTVAGRPFSEFLAWISELDITFVEGSASTYELSSDVSGTPSEYGVEAGTLPTGVTLDTATGQLSYDGVSSPGAQSVQFYADNSALADWNARIAGTGVVWHHDFETEDEVNAFRWTGSPGTGNDPSDAFPATQNSVIWEENGGITNGALALYHPAASIQRSAWWRPMSPLKGSVNSPGLGNGRLADDPGANGTITALDWDPESSANTTRDHQVGYYINPTYEATYPGQFDGNEYYFQVRHNVDTRRWLSSYFTSGKRIYFTRTDRSLTDQEIVLEGGDSSGLDNNPPIDWLSLYRSGSPPLEQDPPGTVAHGNQPNSEIGYCRFDGTGGNDANCWAFAGDAWDTLLFHVVEGTDGGSDTTVEVWVASPGQTTYTKIWDQQNIPLPYDAGQFGGALGHNGIIMSIFQNFNTPTSEFYYRWCQMIFSKEFIPCPQV